MMIRARVYFLNRQAHSSWGDVGGGVRTALLLSLLCLGLFAGEAHGQFTGPAPVPSVSTNIAQTPTTDPAILYPPQREILLGTGDLITLRVYGTADYTPTVRVSLDGSIQVPLLGLVHVDGLSLHEAEKKVADQLIAAGMYRDPQVTIQVIESPNQFATVVGEIHGTILITGQKRLFDVLAASGGLSPTASHTVTINRPGLEQPIVVDLGPDPANSSRANVPIFARDTIVISRVGVVYLLGAFRTQGAIPMQASSPLTLMQVAALGGGPGWEGKMNDLRIVRTHGLERTLVRVDIQKVLKGKVPDPILQPEDIVFLPTSAMKASIKSGGLGTATGIASFLIFAFHN